MELRNLSYGELANRIREEQKEIIVYGAGMIGQIVCPKFSLLLIQHIQIADIAGIQE